MAIKKLPPVSGMFDALAESYSTASFLVPIGANYNDYPEYPTTEMKKEDYYDRSAAIPKQEQTQKQENGKPKISKPKKSENVARMQAILEEEKLEELLTPPKKREIERCKCGSNATYVTYSYGVFSDFGDDVVKCGACGKIVMTREEIEDNPDMVRGLIK